MTRSLVLPLPLKWHSQGPPSLGTFGDRDWGNPLKHGDGFGVDALTPRVTDCVGSAQIRGVRVAARLSPFLEVT